MSNPFIPEKLPISNIDWASLTRVIGEAMNCAMIIAYARPFSGNDKAALEKIPDFPGRYVRHLDERGRQVHELVIKDRNNKMAHSDSDALKMITQAIELGGG